MSLLNRIVPFILAGVVLAVLAFGLVLLAYLLLIGSLIGAVLYLYNQLRLKFFAPRKEAPPIKPSGRVIDSDDWRKL